MVHRHLGIAVAIAGAVFTQSKLASAEGPRAHARVGAALPGGPPQSDDFGVGGVGALSAELPLVSIVSASADAGMIFLSPKDPPPGRPARSTATVTTFTAGARIHLWPSKSPGGPWVGLGAGLGLNGPDARFVGNFGAGWDFLLGAGAFGVGPFLGYTHVLEPGTSLLEQDAKLITGGVQVSFGSPPGPHVEAPKERKPVPPEQDMDGDGVADQDDACPKVKGVPTNDLNTNGCPRQDADKDGVPDDEDACPNLAGEPRADPRMNGCPAVLPPKDDDRDSDGIPSSVDACPDEAGKPSDDPKKHGCPPAADLELD